MGLFSIFKKSNTLYYPGCVTFFKFPDYFELYKNIFSKLGIEFKVIDKKICCGLPALEGGYDPEARKIARRNFEIFKEEEIASIITNSPCCFKMFSIDYPKLVPDWDIEVKNVWRIILSRLEAKPNLVKFKGNGIVTYSDSCYLGRYCEIYDEPRKILELLGYEIKELPDSFEKSICCGSCGGVNRTNPELANEIAKNKIMQAKRFGINRIVVCSFEEYDLLKNNSIGSGVEIFELSDLIGLALGLKKQEEKVDPKVDEIIEESSEDENKESDSEEDLEDSEELELDEDKGDTK